MAINFNGVKTFAVVQKTHIRKTLEGIGENIASGGGAVDFFVCEQGTAFFGDKPTLAALLVKVDEVADNGLYTDASLVIQMVQQG